MGMDFEQADRVRRELGLDGLTVTLPPDFGEPAFSRLLLGLEVRELDACSAYHLERSS